MNQWLKYLFLGICAWYFILIVGHFHNLRPLWNDELCVLNNITSLSTYDLFSRCLLSDQAFPRLYLWIIQQLYHLTGQQLWSLRLLPCLCMAGAFLIWMRIGTKVLKRPIDRITFALCWASSIPLIYYAAELKQYSMDVLVGSVLVLLMLRASSWMLCLFPLLGFLSYPVFFLMLIPILKLWTKKKELSIYVFVCLVMVFYVWYVDIRHSAAHLLETYWHEYFISFASIPDFFQTLGDGINNLISRWFVEIPKIFRAIARGFVGFGFAYMLWQGVKSLKVCKINVSMIAFVVFIELVILGCLRKFPFTVPRLSLFFAPMLLFVMVEAFATLRARWPKIYWPLQVCLWVYLTIMSIGIAKEIFSGDLGAQSSVWANLMHSLMSQ